MSGARHPEWAAAPAPAVSAREYNAVDPVTGLGMQVTTYGSSWYVHVHGSLDGIPFVTVGGASLRHLEDAQVDAIDTAARLYAAGARPREGR